MSEPVEQAFTQAGQAITTAADVVNRLRDLAGVGAVQSGGYLAYCAGRLGEAMHGLALARNCDRLAKEKQQGDLFKFRPVVQDAA